MYIIHVAFMLYIMTIKHYLYTIYDYMYMYMCTLNCALLPHKQVNEMYEGKAAIHVAAMEGYLPIVRLLIKYTADLDIKVCDQLGI